MGVFKTELSNSLQYLAVRITSNAGVDWLHYLSLSTTELSHAYQRLMNKCTPVSGWGEKNTKETNEKIKAEADKEDEGGDMTGSEKGWVSAVDRLCFFFYWFFLSSKTDSVSLRHLNKGSLFYNNMCISVKITDLADCANIANAVKNITLNETLEHCSNHCVMLYEPNNVYDQTFSHNRVAWPACSFCAVQFYIVPFAHASISLISSLFNLHSFFHLSSLLSINLFLHLFISLCSSFVSHVCTHTPAHAGRDSKYALLMIELLWVAPVQSISGDHISLQQVCCFKWWQHVNLPNSV